MNKIEKIKEVNVALNELLREIEIRVFVENIQGINVEVDERYLNSEKKDHV